MPVAFQESMIEQLYNNEKPKKAIFDFDYDGCLANSEYREKVKQAIRHEKLEPNSEDPSDIVLRKIERMREIQLFYLIECNPGLIKQLCNIIIEEEYDEVEFGVFSARQDYITNKLNSEYCFRGCCYIGIEHLMDAVIKAVDQTIDSLKKIGVECKQPKISFKTLLLADSAMNKSAGSSMHDALSASNDAFGVYQTQDKWPGDESKITIAFVNAQYASVRNYLDADIHYYCIDDRWFDHNHKNCKDDILQHLYDFIAANPTLFPNDVSVRCCFYNGSPDGIQQIGFPIQGTGMTDGFYSKRLALMNSFVDALERQPYPRTVLPSLNADNVKKIIDAIAADKENDLESTSSFFSEDESDIELVVDTLENNSESPSLVESSIQSEVSQSDDDEYIIIQHDVSTPVEASPPELFESDCTESDDTASSDSSDSQAFNTPVFSDAMIYANNRSQAFFGSSAKNAEQFSFKDRYNENYFADNSCPSV